MIYIKLLNIIFYYEQISILGYITFQVRLNSFPGKRGIKLRTRKTYSGRVNVQYL